jgi:uncharacterized membrane protein
MTYLWLKWVHILSATVLFGTGLGIAYFKYRADRSGDLAVIAGVSRLTVAADWLFTAPAVVIQLLTGLMLARIRGWAFTEGWILASLALYFVAGACWIPVVALQIRMRDIALRCLAAGVALPPEYARYRRAWTLLGGPAFGAVLVIVYLMIFKPAFRPWAWS